ncbi:GtrA family protein [Psychrobacter sp. CAL346-MNA-CIBAN-0220]|uniref:GtrA family protein n=1 Tax=Psychrobacter sp. CAL346-MNA-CIBAN-0220 TaxID=3140457 RepID=UPI0033253C18
MNKIAITKSASQQALWFLIVGASAALVHFLVLVSIVSFTVITPAWANVMAFLVAFVVSFLGHFYLTFRQSDRYFGQDTYNSESAKHKSWHHSLPTLVKWFASSAAGFIANQGLFLLGLNWFGERYYMLIWLIVTGVITIMTFALGKLWAFK